MTDIRRLLATALLPLALLAGAACGDDDTPSPGAESEDTEATTAPDDAMTEPMTITATDYAFDLPETLPAGEHTFTLVNEGKEPHFIEIVELKPDAPPVDKLIKIKKADKFFVRRAGGTKPVKPGEESKPFDSNLTSGRYGYVCFIETKDGTPHAFLGMAGEFTVE
jgi:hypothetical protein